jgi:Mg/Co/Ni transporter MgtE
MCVVVNGGRVPLGTLSLDAMVSDPNAAAEQLMESGPATVRPSWSFEETSEYLKGQDLDRALVTTSEGILIGVYSQSDAARHMGNFPASKRAARSDQ